MSDINFEIIFFYDRENEDKNINCLNKLFKNIEKFESNYIFAYLNKNLL